jgi:hypothetical protein
MNTLQKIVVGTAVAYAAVVGGINTYRLNKAVDPARVGFDLYARNYQGCEEKLYEIKFAAQDHVHNYHGVRLGPWMVNHHEKGDPKNAIVSTPCVLSYNVLYPENVPVINP